METRLRVLQIQRTLGVPHSNQVSSALDPPCEAIESIHNVPE